MTQWTDRSGKIWRHEQPEEKARLRQLGVSLTEVPSTRLPGNFWGYYLFQAPLLPIDRTLFKLQTTPKRGLPTLLPKLSLIHLWTSLLQTSNLLSPQVLLTAVGSPCLARWSPQGCLNQRASLNADGTLTLLSSL